VLADVKKAATSCSPAIVIARRAISPTNGSRNSAIVHVRSTRPGSHRKKLIRPTRNLIVNELPTTVLRTPIDLAAVVESAKRHKRC